MLSVHRGNGECCHARRLCGLERPAEVHIFSDRITERGSHRYVRFLDVLAVRRVFIQYPTSLARFKEDQPSEQDP